MRNLDRYFPGSLTAAHGCLNAQGNGYPPDPRMPRFETHTALTRADLESDANRPCPLHEKSSRCPLRGTARYAAEPASPNLFVLGGRDVQSHRNMLSFRRK